MGTLKPMFHLDMDEVRSFLPKSDWINFSQYCVRYHANPNKMVAVFIHYWAEVKNEYLASKGQHPKKRSQKPAGKQVIRLANKTKEVVKHE